MCAGEAVCPTNTHRDSILIWNWNDHVKKIIRAEDGFTFLELMAVLALLGLLYFFALPSVITSFEQRHTAFGSWLMANARNFRTVSQSGAAGDMYIYIDLDSESVWTGSGSGGKGSSPRKLDGDVNILSVEFISGLKVDSGVARIGFYSGGYSDGVIIYTSENGRSFSYRMEPFLDDIQTISGHVSWDG